MIPARDKWRKSYFYPISRINLIHVTFKFRDLKECDGTHSERSARKVPTLRNQRKHRRSIGDLWAFCGQKFSFRFFMRFYNNAAKIFGIWVVLC